MTFADKVRKRLAERKRSQADLAEAIGTSQQQVSSWLNQGVIPSTPLAFRAAKYLGLTLEFLLDDSLEDPPDHQVDASEVCVSRQLLSLFENYPPPPGAGDDFPRSAALPRVPWLCDFLARGITDERGVKEEAIRICNARSDAIRREVMQTRQLLEIAEFDRDAAERYVVFLASRLQRHLELQCRLDGFIHSMAGGEKIEVAWDLASEPPPGSVSGALTLDLQTGEPLPSKGPRKKRSG